MKIEIENHDLIGLGATFGPGHYKRIFFSSTCCFFSDILTFPGLCVAGQRHLADPIRAAENDKND